MKYKYHKCTSLKSIVIPDSVDEIGEGIFSKCSSLKSIHFESRDVDCISMDENAFGGLDLDQCILYVPAGTRWAYRHHEVFGQFKHIEIETK